MVFDIPTKEVNLLHSSMRGDKEKTDGGKEIDEQSSATRKEVQGPANSELFIAKVVASQQVPAAGILIQICLAVVLAVTCEVGLSDIVFSVAYPLYLILANHWRFRNNETARKASRNHEIDLDLFPDQNEWFAIYMIIFSIVGLLLPLGTVILGPKDIKIAAAPPLFLLWCQITMETLALNSIYFHDLIRILVPVGFNAYKMRSLMIWCNKSLELLPSSSDFWQHAEDDQDFGDTSNNESWYYWGLVLAFTNLVLWTYNLFVVLLLRMMPNFMHPQRSPSPEVKWKGQLIPITSPSTRKEDKKKDE